MVMEYFSLSLIVCFSLYKFFLFYMQKWMKEFRGASIKFEYILTFVALFLTIYGFFYLGFLIYLYGFIPTLKFFGTTFVITLFLIGIEAVLFIRVRDIVHYIGMLAFPICPILGIIIWIIK